MTGRVSILAIDPSLTRTGIAIADAPSQMLADRLFLLPGERRLLAAISGGEKADGGLRHLWLEAASLLPLGQPWIAVVERPPPFRSGIGNAPLAAEREALRWVDDLSRERSRALRQRHRKLEPLRPRPGEWRSPLGLATSAPRGWSEKKQDRADYIKEQAVRLAGIEADERAAAGAPITIDTDSAEAVCLAIWVIRSVGITGTWFRPKKPIALRAVA